MDEGNKTHSLILQNFDGGTYNILNCIFGSKF